MNAKVIPPTSPDHAHDNMPAEIDFANGVRGRFFEPNLRLISPVRLDPEVVDFLAARAQAKGITLNALVNQLLKKDIELIEAAH